MPPTDRFGGVALELTTRFAGISSSPKARGGLSPSDAAAKAKANLRYIDRRSAARPKDARGAGRLLKPDESPVRTRTEGRAAMRRAIDARAGRGGKNGSRVAEKIVFSLPNDFKGDAAREALVRVLHRLVGDSDAVAYGVIHTDRPGNLHGHILAVDGPESVEAARQRRPNAKRLRRRDQLRMGDMGRPREIREMIAAEINAVAKRRKLTMVEHRSFKARGIERLPGSHLGPQQIARLARDAAQKVQDRIAPQRRTRRPQPPQRVM